MLLDETPADEPVALSLFVSELGYDRRGGDRQQDGHPRDGRADARRGPPRRHHRRHEQHEQPERGAGAHPAFDAPEPPGSYAGRPITPSTSPGAPSARSTSSAARGTRRRGWSSEGCRASMPPRRLGHCECGASTLQLEAAPLGAARRRRRQTTSASTSWCGADQLRRVPQLLLAGPPAADDDGGGGGAMPEPRLGLVPVRVHHRDHPVHRQRVRAVRRRPARQRQLKWVETMLNRRPRLQTLDLLAGGAGT